MKIGKLLTLIVVSTLLSGCDLFGGGEEVDPKLYELKITTNLDKAKDRIKAEFSGERDDYEIEELKKAGATQEDIDKAGTCVEGTYYFFDQDAINLFEPFLPGYEFLGWYNGDEFLGYIDSDYDGIPNYIWNMPNKNTTLEARFKLMNFEILYMDDGTGPAEFTGNPTTWNVEQGEVVLNHKDKESDGYKFDGWTFAMGGNTRYDGYVTKLNEQFLIDSNVAKVQSNGAETLTFSLHENYSVIKHTFKVTFDKNYVNNVYVNVKEPGESAAHDLIDGKHFIDSGDSGILPHNTEIVIHATSVNSDLYKIDGVYLDGQKISTELSISEFKFILDRDAEVEIRYISLV